MPLKVGDKSKIGRDGSESRSKSRLVGEYRLPSQ